MGPKKVPSKVSLVKKVRNTMEFKKEVIDKYESGMRVLQLARMYGKNKSTISSILAKKEQIKEADVAKGVTMLTKKRSQALEDVEKLLLVWIKEKQLAGDSVVEAIICKMARQLHADLVKKMPGASADVSEFKASRGWFERFKKRSGIHNVVKHGEAASSDKPATEEFVDEFKEYIEVEGFLPKQVFSCDETGLFWKKMPKRTYITQEEKALPGHKPMKDRLTLLFCGNASGDFKVKPLLVYHTENPQVFKKNNVIKSKLCVMWKANNTAWVTRQIFVDWVIEVFGPSVKKYLQENKLPLKCLLVLDSAPAHPPDLEDQLLEEYSFIRVKFLPPDTTPPIQPMNQQVISNFKKLYTKAVFERCFEVTSGTELTLREFWRNHFTILHCISLIDKAWQEVTSRTINSSWRKLWPECVLQKDLEGFEADHDDPTPVVESVVSLGKSMGLDVSDQDVEELVDDHTEELTTKELQELHLEKQQIAAEEIASEEEERRENVSSSVIKDICAKWSEVQSFVEKYHPNKAVASRVCNMFNDNALSHFRQILKRRQKQTSLDRFFVQQASSDSQGGLSASKRQTREVTSPPPSPLLTVFDIPRGVINKGVLRCKPEREKISKFAHCESQDKFGTRFKCKTEGPMKIGQPMDVDVCDDTNTYIDDDLIEVKDEQIKMEDWVDNGDCYKMCGDNEDRKDVVTNLHRLDDTSTDISRETTNYSQFYGSRAQRKRDYIVPELHDDSDTNEEVDSGDEYEPQPDASASSEDEREDLSKRSGKVSVKGRNVRKQAIEDDEVAEAIVNNTNATWSKVDITNTPLPDYKHGVPTHVKRPFEYFCELFTAEMLESLVLNTNLYATQTDVNTNFNTTSQEIMQFVGILIFMSMDSLPSLEDYWSFYHCHPDVTTVMTSKRFRLLRTTIHVNDNTEATADRFHKVRPLFEGLRKVCLKVPGTPKQSVDEVMVGYKGTRAGNLRQYIRTKPDKWGFKLFCRASDDGFIHDIMMYQGQTTFDYHNVSLTEEEKKMPISAKVVICLAKTMDHTKTSAIYADNFFTSLPLVKYLHATFNCRYTGTARDGRIGKLPLMSVSDMENKKVKRSAMDYCSLDGVLAVRWKDSKVVTLLTNDVGINPVTKIKRYSKETKQEVEVDCPAVVKNYNAHMGGIYKTDMLVHLYKSPLKAKRWYMRLFGYIIDLCCVNGWLLYRRDCGALKERYMNLKEFRFSISHSARKPTKGIPRSLRSPSSSNLLSYSRSSSLNDIPNRYGKRHRDDTRYDQTHWPVCTKRLSCKHCNTKNKRTYSSFSCSFCKVNLCLNSMRNCFLEFHKEQDA
ncbi:uncharacterized protein [Cherax quadricarinatus]|uniref:uncharacterized protein isoform X4 n=1 Tax=Cherax quadricarinatus TaxID=27406 RepID=UPI00387E7FBB